MIKKQQGLSFIEVLVAVVVIAIGLLGIVGLQGAAVGNTTISSMRSTAAIEANNLVARMRANTAFWRPGTDPENITAGSGYTVAMTSDGANNSYDTEIRDGESLPDPNIFAHNRDCSADDVHGCPPHEIAAYDIRQWYEGLTTSLHPKASASIEYTSVTVGSDTVNFIRITITWDERGSAFAGAGNNPKSYTVSVNL